MHANKNEEKSKGMNVQVVVRSRPLNSREVDGKEATVINCSPAAKEITFTNPKASITKTFSFDAVYGPNSTQSELFEQTVRPIVDEVLKGFNCTLFAYGQTGTGKTYTMEGKPDNEIHAGVIPRSIYYIFDALEKSSSEYTVRVSHLELYNEELRDLLCTETKQLRIYDGLMDVTGKKGCTVNNLEEVIVSDAHSIFAVIDNSFRKRHTAETLLNPYSSRSHCIFTITIHTKEATPDGEDLLKVGKLNLVDLAGSENISRSGASGDRKREAGLINTSLLTLGRVINALTEHSSHVPYRESKLTRLLQDSLGGKTKTCVIATISPAAGCMEETLSTLDYAHRAKNIRNRPEVNQKMTRKALIKEYTTEIEKLKILLRSARDKNGVYVPTDTFESMEAELTLRRTQVGDVEQILEKREAELEALKTAVGEKVVEIEEKDKIILSSRDELEKTTQQYNATKDSLHHTQKQLTTHKAYGNALLSNLDTTLHDREELFNKIDRKRTMESTNKNNVEHARVVLQEKVRYLENTLSQAHNTQSSFFCEMQSDLSEFLKRKDEHMQTLCNQSEALMRLVAMATHSLADVVKAIERNSINTLTSISTQAQQQSKLSVDHMSEFYHESLLAVAAIRQVAAEQSAETISWANNHMECMRNQNKESAAFLSQQSIMLKEISEQVNNLASQQQERLQAHQNSLNSFAESHTSSLHTWQSGFMSQMEDIVRGEVERQTHKLNSEVAAMASRLASDMISSRTGASCVLQGIDEAVAHVDHHKQHTAATFDQPINMSLQYIKGNDKYIASLATVSSQLEDKATTYHQHCTSTHQNYSTQLTTTTLAGTEELALLTKKYESLNANTSEVIDKSLLASQHTFTNLNSDIIDFNQNVTTKIIIADTNAKQIHADIQSKLADANSTVVDFKEDLSTGVTPIKRSIPIPQLEQFSSPYPHSTQTQIDTPTNIYISSIPIQPISPTIIPFSSEVQDDTKLKKITFSQQSTISTKHSKIPKMLDKKTQKIISNKENVLNIK